MTIKTLIFFLEHGGANNDRKPKKTKTKNKNNGNKREHKVKEQYYYNERAVLVELAFVL